MTIRYLTGATNEAVELRVREGLELGLLVQPGTAAKSGYGDALGAYPVWAGDNGAFTTKPGGFDPIAFRKMLADPMLQAARSSCAFVVAPDVLIVDPDGSVRGDAAATLERFGSWSREIRAAGFPVALVAQDGLDEIAGRIPWDDLDALFLGASTDWKLGAGAAALTRAAKRRGKHAHMGRVNSLKRLRIAESFGCDTADGTFLRFGPTKNLPRLENWIRIVGTERPAQSAREEER